jgi:hypothetical protein
MKMSEKPKRTARARRPGKSKRLRPGEMDELVLACLREHEPDWPMTASAVAKLIGRSGGAVANCLGRLAEARPRRVRLATKRPRAYDLKGVSDAKAG